MYVFHQTLRRKRDIRVLYHEEDTKLAIILKRIQYDNSEFLEALRNSSDLGSKE